MERTPSFSSPWESAPVWERDSQQSCKSIMLKSGRVKVARAVQKASRPAGSSLEEEETARGTAPGNGDSEQGAWGKISR